MSPTPCQPPEIHVLGDLLPAFEFEQLIALGESGAVYKARQPSLGRDVAIKVMPRETSADPFHRTSFMAEAKAMASISHPNVIRVYDSGEVAGMLYMVMEYVPGKSLFHSAHGKAIDPKQAARIVHGACRGLAHAHANGIVHGDLRPANILLDMECEPKIGSFASSCYSPAYLAPEVADAPESAGAASDVYAMGVILRELLTGIPPGGGNRLMAGIADATLAGICREATHADPRSRCQDANALASRLESWLSGGSLPVANRRIPSQPVMPALRRTALPPAPGRTPSPAWTLAKSCAVIAALLLAIQSIRGTHQGKMAISGMQPGNEPTPVSHVGAAGRPAAEALQ